MSLLQPKDTICDQARDVEPTLLLARVKLWSELSKI